MIKVKIAVNKIKHLYCKLILKYKYDMTPGKDSIYDQKSVPSFPNAKMKSIKE